MQESPALLELADALDPLVLAEIVDLQVTLDPRVERDPPDQRELAEILE
jgi:hypothetical protein